MKKSYKVLLSCVMVALAVVFTGCEGEEGKMGPSGDAEAASFGSVVLTISGTDWKGNPYSEVLDFKYLGYELAGSSSWYRNDNGRSFSISRDYKIEAKSGGRQKSVATGVTINVSEVNGELVPDEFIMDATFIVGNALVDESVFMLSGDFDGENFVISNYTFDEKTGALKFDFTLFKEREGKRLEIAGKVDVKVYESQYVFD